MDPTVAEVSVVPCGDEASGLYYLTVRLSDGAADTAIVGDGDPSPSGLHPEGRVFRIAGDRLSPLLDGDGKVVVTPERVAALRAESFRHALREVVSRHADVPPEDMARILREELYVVPVMDS